MKVLITSNSFGKFDPKPRKMMEDLGWEVVGNRYHHIMNEEEMMGEVPGVDAIILGSDTVSKKVLDQADSLKIISRYGVGIDNIDLQEAEAPISTPLLQLSHLKALVLAESLNGPYF